MKFHDQLHDKIHWLESKTGHEEELLQLDDGSIEAMMHHHPHHMPHGINMGINSEKIIF